MYSRYTQTGSDVQLRELSFKRPFGTPAAWAPYPALKRRAIFRMSLWDKASGESCVSIHVEPGQTPELLEGLKWELPPGLQGKIMKLEPPSQTGAVVKT